MRPAHVEGNQFTYHLKQLVAHGLIEKSAGVYSLTTQGVQLVSGLYFEHSASRAQPKIVTFVVCTNADGAFATYDRNREPFLGMSGFPYGIVQVGESVHIAATRELEEKTGLTSTLTQKGIMYLLIKDAHGDVITHLLCHVFVGMETHGDLCAEAQYGALVWRSEKELFTQNTMPGVRETLEIARRPEHELAFEEYEFQRA